MGVLLVIQETRRRYQDWEMAMTIGGHSTNDCVVRLGPLGRTVSSELCYLFWLQEQEGDRME